MFNSLHFVVASVAVIATITDFRVASFPRPQQDDLTFVDGFAFEGGADRSIPVGPSNPTRAPANGQTPRPNVVSTTAPTVPSTTASTDVSKCAERCPFQGTAEYNPVCGTNQILYDNPSKLECARNCGLAVELAHYGRCSSNIRG